MTRRAELVTLIEKGTPPDKIYEYFSAYLGRSSILGLLKQAGVSMPIPSSKDEITDERRRYLQELSISD